MDTRLFLASVQDYAQATLMDLCKPAERDGTKSDSSLLRVQRGENEVWYKLKRVTQKSAAKICHAVNAAKVVEAVHTAELAYAETVEACGEETADKLFDAAFDFGRSDAQMRQKGEGYHGFVRAEQYRENARKTRQKRMKARPDFRGEVQKRLNTGMQLTAARREVADLFDYDIRTVANDMRRMKKEKR